MGKVKNEFLSGPLVRGNLYEPVCWLALRFLKVKPSFSPSFFPLTFVVAIPDFVER